MTDTPPPLPLPSAPPEGGKRSFTGFLFLLAILLAALYFLLFSPWAVLLRHEVTASITQSDTHQLADLEKKVQILEDQVRSLNTRLEQNNNQTAALPPSTANTEDSVHARQTASDIAHMQNDMIALSAALSAVQTEVKAVNDHALKTQASAQASLASAIAFIQLRDTALTGQGFAPELKAMRDAGRSDNVTQDVLSKLEPYATQGAPTLPALREQLIPLETPALQALDKKTAQNWWQKFLAELRGLVSVRPLHGGGPSDAFTAMESGLDRGDIHAVIAALQNLPPESQDILSDWRSKVDARMHINDGLHALADHLTATTSSAPDSPHGEP